MGLLGDDLSDPQSMAVLALAGGLLSPGSLGQGLSRGIQGYQGTLQGAQDLALKKSQVQAAQQEAALRDLTLQQQKRTFDLQTPFLEEAVRRMRGQSAPAQQPVDPGQPSVMAGSGAVPSFMSTNPTMGGTAPAPAPAPAQKGTLFPGVPDNVAFGMIGTGGFAKIPDAISSYNAPTDFTKMLNAAGIDPGSPMGRQLIQSNIAKQNYVAPTNARPGSIIRDPFTQQPVAFNPHIPEGGTPLFDASGNVSQINGIPGATGVIGDVARAKEAGQGSVLPFSGLDANGNPLPVTNRTAAATGGMVVTPAAQASAIRAAIPLMLSERQGMAPGPDRDALDREINRNQNALLTNKPFTTTTTASSAPSGAIYSAPPMGAQTTATESAKDTVDNYNTLHTFATNSAPRNIGLLQTIEQLADKTMIGPGASKVQFVNGVLNSIGITPGADQAQNYQIMKKNLNMLVGSQRMGASGGGSDALQSLLEAANPNVADMNGPAAKEAAQELIAYNRMMMAKDKTLPNPISVPTLQYQKAETAFAPYNDPRLWQLEHAQNDQERVRILSLMPPADRAALIKKAGAARAAGVLN